MVYSLTDQNLVIVLGGHKKPGLGAQRHHPIFKNEAGEEYISLNGQTLVKVSSLTLDKWSRREVRRR
jgi:hypothetical protein